MPRRFPREYEEQPLQEEVWREDDKTRKQSNHRDPGSVVKLPDIAPVKPRDEIPKDIEDELAKTFLGRAKKKKE